jgi:thymidylate synthase (FAD)
MIEFKFSVKLPIFIARQMVRHRTANLNEYSGRYSMMKDEFYKPEIENVRQQSSVNKQGGSGSINETDASGFIEKIDSICNQSYEEYEKAIQNGVAREQARMLLPVNLYTEWYWKVDLHNLLHFLALRCDAHAQWEIRVFANAMLELIKPIVPWAIEAWEDYHEHRGAIRLTKLEVDAMVSSLGGISVNSLKTDNKREQEEWKTKAAMLGLSVRNIEK